MKKNGIVLVCMDYRDLKSTSLKDNFPLPSIDQSVDLVVGYEMMSIIEGFLSYN